MDRIRQRDGIDHLVAIAMSGNGRAADVERAMEFGFDGHLTKPAAVDDCKVVVARRRGRGTLAKADVIGPVG